MSGLITKPFRNQIKPGNVLIGLKSSGLHSNGFTLVRQLFGNKLRDEFITPTRVYLDTVLELSKKIDIEGMMHITGGAFTKLKDVAEGSNIYLDFQNLPIPQIFQEIYTRKVSDQQMYRTFNCGIGFVVAVKSKDVALAQKITKGFVIGKAVKGSGRIIIDSAFSKNQIDY